LFSQPKTGKAEHMISKAWIWVWALPLAVGAAEIPAPILPAGVGVNIHFTRGHTRDLDLIAEAGFKFVRMDFGWSGIERKKGEYDWSEYEELAGNLEQRGLRAILILDYSNPLYEETVTSPDPLYHLPRSNTASPQHPESIAAYARWAAASARHFTGRHVIWELWNEPNGNFWCPKPDAHQYTAMALAAAKAIREAEPEATVIGPASSGFPWEFLKTFLESGVLEYLDAVSVHPYRNKSHPPETAAGDYQRLRDLIDASAPATRKGKIPILSGEWGYSTQEGGVSLETQAAFAVRQQLANLLEGVPLSIWYDWKNDGPDTKDGEHNFGTVHADLSPKPAYLAMKTLTHELGGYRIVRRLDLPSDKDYLLICAGPADAQKLVGWTLGEPHVVSNEIARKDRKKAAGVMGDGRSFVPRIVSGHLELDLTAAPQYVALGGSSPK
jgi:hypothetical protein